MGGQTIYLLSEQALKEKLANNLPEILSLPAVVKDFRLKFLGLSPSPRQTLAQDIIAILKANNQAIGQALVTQNGLRLPPTLANWLADYADFAGQYFSPEKREEYLKTAEKDNLAGNERVVLANLFDLYGFFSQITNDPEGLDAVLVKDKTGRLKMWQNGQLKEMNVSPAFSPLPAVPPAPPRLPPSFEPEDEAEIKNHTDNLSQYGPSQNYNVEEIISKIAARYKLTFSEEIFSKRFISIITARLKEFRNRADTLDLLTRSVKIGGLEYPPELAEQILEDLDKEIPRLQQVKPPQKSKPENIPVTPQEALKKSLIQANVFRSPTPEVVPPKKVPVNPVPLESVPPKPPIPELEPERKEVVSRPMMHRPPASSAKPRMDDIKSRAKIFGPIEELKAMTVNDFRRLGTAKATAAQRVADKINLLREDSFHKFAEGLKAWRAGEVYQLYLNMGMESMEKGKSIRETIERMTNAGLPTLSEQEFNSIVDLNRKLRY
ncbi:MAG: hypothetical protein WC528_01010 [Patescibacteria group bacterium]